MYSPPDKAWEYINYHNLPTHIIHMSEGGGLPPQEIVVTGVHHDEKGVIFIKSTKPGRQWELPTGRVEDGEDIDTAIERELAEETGRDVRSASPELAVLWVFPEKTMTNIVFTVELGPQVRDPTGEVEDINSFTDIPGDVSFNDSGRVAYDYIISELVHGNSQPSMYGYADRLPVSKPSKRTISALAGLTISSVVIAGAHRLFTDDTDDGETNGGGWRGTFDTVRNR